jgi:DNA-binding response OmpR family regulator
VATRSTPAVAVIEPERADATVAQRLLENNGAAVFLADDLAAAAEHLGGTSWQALLVDLTLDALIPIPASNRRRGDPYIPYAPPVSHGYALLRPVELDPAAAQHPIVRLASGTDGPLAHRRYAVVDFIAKPLDGEALRLKVGGLLAGGPRRAEASAGTDVGGFAAIHKALRTALVVDADPLFRKWFRGIMALHGFKVHEAAGAEDGLLLATSQRPWLIVSDLDLLGPMSGIELCRRLRAHVLTSHTPFIFLADRDGYEERYSGLTAGADDFLTKRASTRELLIRLQLVLKRIVELDVQAGRRAAIEGRIELVGAAGLLQLCHLSQLSGTLTVRSRAEVAQILFREGMIVRAEMARTSGANAVYRLLGWSNGRFLFLQGPAVNDPPLADSFDLLMLEGCRVLDEERRHQPAAPA